jgi:DNA-binding response OmpR family regulator
MCKVLIVDDDPVIVYLYREVLEKAGRHEVIVSNNGMHIPEMIEAERPNIVMLDIQLPGKSGIDVYNEIQSCTEKSLRKIPVMFISAGYFNPTEISNLTGVSRDRCVMKPIDFRQLLSKIDSIVKPHQKVLIANGS